MPPPSITFHWLSCNTDQLDQIRSGITEKCLVLSEGKMTHLELRYVIFGPLEGQTWIYMEKKERMANVWKLCACFVCALCRNEKKSHCLIYRDRFTITRSHVFLFLTIWNCFCICVTDVPHFMNIQLVFWGNPARMCKHDTCLSFILYSFLELCLFCSFSVIFPLHLIPSFSPLLSPLSTTLPTKTTR